MYRSLPYILLFIVTILLQLCFFNRLAFGPLCSPLIYIALPILLPLDTRPVVLLGAGLLCGLAADYSMGTVGLNVAATLPIAFLRPNLIHLLSQHDEGRDEGIPSPERMGKRIYRLYLAVMVGLHHLIFFTLEALSWTMLPQTLLRIVLSGIVSIAVIALTERLLTLKFARS